MEGPQDHEAKIIPFPSRHVENQSDLWPVERINGIRLRLGSMSLDELRLLASHCRDREANARLDALIVEDHLDARLGNDPDGFGPEDVA